MGCQLSKKLVFVNRPNFLILYKQNTNWLATLLGVSTSKFLSEVFNKIFVFFLLVIARVKVGKNSDYGKVKCQSSSGSGENNTEIV